ncbi:MAG: aminotransferase class V-fold PLP-dependent enzyme [Chitinophagales bacterium]
MIYLDNAATSWPKPPEVYQVLGSFLQERGANPGRGGHQMALAAARTIVATRCDLAELLGVRVPERIVFTANATEATNLAIQGRLKPGDHVVTTDVEHNAIMRPLYAMRDRGVEVTVAVTDGEGRVSADELRAALRPSTRMIAVGYASNVLGTVQPVAEIGRLAREAGVTFLCDAAQAVGELPVDLEASLVDLAAFSGHKGLLGPPGTGALYIAEGHEPAPLHYGGTGSRSELEQQPDIMPDRYESGTANSVGLAALGAGVRFLLQQDVARVHERLLGLTQRLLDGLLSLPGVEVYGPRRAEERVALVAFNVRGLASSDAAFMLDQAYGIACRGGLHCAPAAHRKAGTLQRGAIRFSPGVFTTDDEIERALAAVAQLAREAS